jgi:hypothetical protein
MRPRKLWDLDWSIQCWNLKLLSSVFPKRGNSEGVCKHPAGGKGADDTVSVDYEYETRIYQIAFA